MILQDLCATMDRLPIPAANEREQPDVTALRSIRQALAEAVVDDRFLADCLSLELDLIAARRPRSGLVPFHVMPGTGVRFALGYWPPGATLGPHEHTAWTVTAVCRNELEVYTFDREASYRRGELVPKNRFEAPAGKVGYVAEPCIHAPINTSSSWTLSLHVSSPHDGEPLDEHETTIPGLARPFARSAHEEHPYSRVTLRRRLDHYLELIARIAATLQVEDAADLVCASAHLGSTRVRRLAGELRGEASLALEPAWRLERTEPGVEMSCCVLGGRVALIAQTPDGMREELLVEPIARSAIELAVESSSFGIDELPGALTAAERRELGAALEETGLFWRGPK